MRLHQLEIVGFGPFADPVTIDFDSLSDAGLFLLSGPTGAGKSSVLDAICFALYGDVPGDRSAAKRLRSDHAGDDVAPRVVLEATLSGRRFRIDRSPAWTRPKKRGTGTTTEQARVMIAERRCTDGADAWHPLSTRLDETGHLVTRLVGMTLPQFCQVAMLPQGRFQAFLRARSEERHALLQQVFQTGRFDRTERWMRERRVELRRASEAHQAAVADLASRVSEVGGDAAPADWPTEPALLGAWVEELATRAATASAEQASLVETASAAELAASEAAATGAELAALRATHAAARRAWTTIEASAPAHEARKARVARAQRAGAVRPLHELAMSARQEVEQLDQQGRTARRSLAALLGVDTLDDQEIAAHQRAATRTLTDLARIRPLRSLGADLEHQLAELTRTREETTASLGRVEARLGEIPAILLSLRPALTAARDAQEQAVDLTADLQVLGSRVRAARSAESLTARLAMADEALRDATHTRLLAREMLVEIRERRLDGMAAEIAGKLAVGGCCPVCGSADHPSPASPSPDAPDEVAERDARREVDDLEVVVEAHSQQVRGVETQRATALAEAGGSLELLLAEEERTVTRLEQTRSEAAALASHAARVEALEVEQQDLTREHHELVAAATRLDTETAVLASRIESLSAQTSAVVPDGADLDGLTSLHQEVEALAQQCAAAAADLARAHVTATSTQDAAHTTAAQAGFDSSADAAAAWLPEAEVVSLQHQIHHHDREAARVSDLLGDEALLGAAAADAPDLEALGRSHHDAREAADLARQSHTSLRERGRRLHGLAQEMREALTAWAPVRADLDLVADLAALVEGKHPDNRLQMRLSAFVLAHRLGQVVEAANLRLSLMSDQRYSLVHTPQRGAGETRGGLSLLVRDDWTGDTRDPVTLSGGETFVVSLALALGLADVITDEAGGTDLDTLFVDEGFGSLDSETLEDVMDTLDALRDGGRVVGVVSHVPELQTRIPTQLRVHRGRHGSRTTLRLGQ